MNLKQLAFVELLAKWAKGNLVDASYAVIGKELGVTPVAAFLRTKTLEKHGWVKRKEGKLYLHPKFTKGNQEEWDAIAPTAQE
jgi:DNA-binding IclR family transcriptional regulator